MNKTQMWRAISAALMAAGAAGLTACTAQADLSAVTAEAARPVQRYDTPQAPAVELQGRVQLAGLLRGPWRHVTYEGQLAHQDGELPASGGSVVATLDTRGDTLQFDARLEAAPLVFDGVRRGYPGIPLQGAVEGSIAVRGTAHRFFTTTDVRGDLGQVLLTGTVAPSPGRIAAESLSDRFSDLNLARVRGTGAATRLAGRGLVSGVYDSVTGPEGSLALDLGATRVGSIALDTVHNRSSNPGSPSVSMRVSLAK